MLFYFIIALLSISTLFTQPMRTPTAHSVDEDILIPSGSVAVPAGKIIIEAKHSDVFVIMQDDSEEMGSPTGDTKETYKIGKDHKVLVHVSRNMAFTGDPNHMFSVTFVGEGYLLMQIEYGRTITFGSGNPSSDKHEKHNRVQWYNDHTPNVTDQDIVITEDLRIADATIKVNAIDKDVTIYLKKDIEVNCHFDSKIILNTKNDHKITFYVDKSISFANLGSDPFFLQSTKGSKVAFLIPS